MEVEQNINAISSGSTESKEIHQDPGVRIDDTFVENTRENEEDRIQEIIDFLAQDNNICFKSQQIGEEDLTIEEKKNIAKSLYDCGHTKFLLKFGKYLKLEHLCYFEKSDEFTSGDYELNLIISQLKIILNEDSRKIVIKNRRYDAMSKMIKENSYFSETEMMQRNPLLYDQLVGQYMSENEKKTRDNIDTVNITFLNVLMEGIDRNHIKTALKDQKEKEECQMEENSSDEEESLEDGSDEDDEKTHSNWGEYEVPESSSTSSVKCEKSVKKEKRKVLQDKHIPFITSTERALLREEFVQEMYRSFLAGEDADFDYCTVDDNINYDCIDVQGKDEEEKYFDSETPEEVVSVDSELVEDKISKLAVTNETIPDSSQNDTHMHEDSDDELDIYMKHLNRHPALVNLLQE